MIRQQEPDLVVCPSCGTYNRVKSQPDNTRALCGRCASPLNTPARVKPPRSKVLQTLSKRRGLVLAIVAVCILLGLVLIGNRGKGKDSASPGTTRVGSARVKTGQTAMKPPAPVRPALPDRRLANGTIIRSSALNGKCQLVVENGLEKDAGVKVVNTGSKQCLVYFYVASKSTHAVQGIPDGLYELAFTAGRDWDDTKQCFTRDNGFSEFDGILSFITVSEVRGDKIYHEYQGHRITLHGVAHGNAPAHGISELEFMSK